MNDFFKTLSQQFQQEAAIHRHWKKKDVKNQKTQQQKDFILIPYQYEWLIDKILLRNQTI